jgi:hypothetical protein
MPVTYNYTNVPSATSTLIKTGGGILHSVVVNQASASGGTISVNDSISATGTTPQIAIINCATTGTFVYDVVFVNGLAVTNSSSPNVVVTYQ